MSTQIKKWKEKTYDLIQAYPFRAGAALSALVVLIVDGITQQIANSTFDTRVLPWLTVQDSILRWLWLAFVLAIIALFYAFVSQLIANARLRALTQEQSPAAVHKAMRDAQGQRVLLGSYLSTSLDVLEGLVAYLAQVVWQGGDPEQAKQLLLKIILKRIQLMYPPQEIPHASVYVPSPSAPDYLTILENVNMPPERVERNTDRWYIGKDAKLQRLKSGTAGQAFIKKKTIVRHIDPKRHKAEEGNDYIPSRNDGDVAVYLAFVAMPIVDGTTCLGILCVDSAIRDTFDGQLALAMLEPSVKLLGSVLKLCQSRMSVP